MAGNVHLFVRLERVMNAGTEDEYLVAGVMSYGGHHATVGTWLILLIEKGFNIEGIEADVYDLTDGPEHVEVGDDVVYSYKVTDGPEEDLTDL